MAKGKRQLAVDSLYFSSNRLKILNPSEKSKIIHVHDKRETTRFHVEKAGGKSWMFAVCGKNKRDAA